MLSAADLAKRPDPLTKEQLELTNAYCPTTHITAQPPAPRRLVAICLGAHVTHLALRRCLFVFLFLLFCLQGARRTT